MPVASLTHPNAQDPESTVLQEASTVMLATGWETQSPLAWNRGLGLNPRDTTNQLGERG